MNESVLRNHRRIGKPPEVEGWGDLYVIRPLGALLVEGFRHLPISPTGVSLLALGTGWASAWYYYLASVETGASRAAVIAGLLLLLHSALDSADGQLARLTGRHTDAGRLIDGACDTASFFAIYFAIWAGYVARGTPYPVLSLLLGALGGMAFGTGAAMVEYLRQVYQDWALGKTRIDATGPDQMLAGIRERVGAFTPLFDRWYRGYNDQQRMFLPGAAELERRANELRARDPEAFERFRPVYARVQLPMLRRWWPMASNAHKSIIAVCAFLPVADTGLLAGLGSYWTFVANLALVPVGAWLVFRQGRVDRELLAALSEIDPARD